MPMLARDGSEGCAVRTIIRFYAAMAWAMVAAAGAHADTLPASTFAGTWALKAEGRNLFVLELDLPAGSTSLTGKLFRPAHMNLSANAVTSVALPVAEEQVVKADTNAEGLLLDFKDDSGSVTEFQMDVTANGADLKFVGIPVPPLHLVRVGDDETVAATWDPAHVYALSDGTEILTDNSELTRLFGADQADRQGSPIDWAQLAVADKARRQAVGDMLRQGQLHTGQDYINAAFIFQHGESSDDYLLAHALAMTALEMGRKDAGWIAAASLDRYLLSIGKPQIYGTQTSKGQNLDRNLIPDSLRLRAGVPALAEQHAAASSANP